MPQGGHSHSDADKIVTATRSPFSLIGLAETLRLRRSDWFEAADINCSGLVISADKTPYREISTTLWFTQYYLVSPNTEASSSVTCYPIHLRRYKYKSFIKLYLFFLLNPNPLQCVIHFVQFFRHIYSFVTQRGTFGTIYSSFPQAFFFHRRAFHVAINPSGSKWHCLSSRCFRNPVICYAWAMPPTTVPGLPLSRRPKIVSLRQWSRVDNSSKALLYTPILLFGALRFNLCTARTWLRSSP